MKLSHFFAAAASILLCSCFAVQGCDKIKQIDNQINDEPKIKITVEEIDDQKKDENTDQKKDENADQNKGENADQKKGVNENSPSETAKQESDNQPNSDGVQSSADPAAAADSPSRTLKLRINPPYVNGKLEPKDIKKVADDNLETLLSCYTNEIPKASYSSADILIRFTVKKGKLTALLIPNSSIENKKVENCIIKSMKKWQFPDDDGFHVIDLPLSFYVE